MTRLLTVAAALGMIVVAAAIGAASPTEAAPKPGLLPGKWHGTGVIKGSVTDEAATTTFSGKIGFRINIDKKLNVTGSGSWVKTMKGRGLASSDMTGIARLVFAGNSRDVRFAYSETVEGTITVKGMTRPVEFVHANQPYFPLTITRARTCSAAGMISIPKESGVTMTWTATKLGCRG